MGFEYMCWNDHIQNTVILFGTLPPFPSHLGTYIIKFGKISTEIHEIGKIKAILGLGMTPI